MNKRFVLFVFSFLYFVGKLVRATSYVIRVSTN